MRNRCKVLNTRYKIDEDKKTVVCIIEWDAQVDKTTIPFWMFTEAHRAGDAGISVGISKCHPDDTFDIVVGKRIAESKAKAKMYKTVLKRWKKVFNYIKVQYIDPAYRRMMACNEAYIGEKEHIKKLSE